MEDNHDKETSTDEVRRQYKRIQKKNGVEGEKARFSALNLLYSGYRLKRPGRGADYPPPSSTDVKERAKLYISPPPLLRAIMASSRVTLYLYFITSNINYGDLMQL